MSAPETELDPLGDAEWEDISVLGQQMITDMLRFLRDVRQEPAWRPVPPDVREQLRTEVPFEVQGVEATYADFRRLVLPYRVGNVHPRFWGHRGSSQRSRGCTVHRR